MVSPHGARSGRKRISTRRLSSGKFTKRELEVLKLLRSGVSNRTIGTALQIAEGTVRRHLENIYPKLGAHSKAEAVARLNTWWELHGLEVVDHSRESEQNVLTIKSGEGLSN